MNEREALTLVRLLLTNALKSESKRVADDLGYVRTLAGRIGELQQGIRAALTVIEQVAPAAEGGTER